VFDTEVKNKHSYVDADSIDMEELRYESWGQAALKFKVECG
jgi:hypothetical protein